MEIKFTTTVRIDESGLESWVHDTQDEETIALYEANPEKFVNEFFKDWTLDEFEGSFFEDDFIEGIETEQN